MTKELNSNFTLRPSVIHTVCKPTSVQNPQASPILERVHQTIMAILCTADLDMAGTVNESDIADFLTNATWAVRSTYHTVLKTSPGAATFGQDMLFEVPFIADWSKIGEYRQKQTKKTRWENGTRVNCDYHPGNKELCVKMVSSAKVKAGMKVIFGPSLHTNGTITVQCCTKSERLNIRRVTPYFD
eukprot:CCRYP_002240-RA/>CCRYP_002240-RA protein AED:0.37 eAED:0.38 QI:0/0/0/1/0/0/2/0/185